MSFLDRFETACRFSSVGRAPLANAALKTALAAALSCSLLAGADEVAANPGSVAAASGVVSTMVVLNVPQEVAFANAVHESESSIAAEAVRLWRLPSVTKTENVDGANVRVSDACPDNDRLIVVSWRLGMRRVGDVGDIVQRLQVFDIDCGQQLLRHALEATAGGAYDPRVLPPFAYEREAAFRKTQLLLVHDLVSRMHGCPELDVPLPLIDLLNY